MFKLIFLLFVFVNADLECEYTCKNVDGDVVLTYKSWMYTGGKREVKREVPQNTKAPKAIPPVKKPEVVTKNITVEDDMMFVGCKIYNVTAFNRFINSGCDDSANEWGLKVILTSDALDKSEYAILQNEKLGYFTCDASLENTPQCEQLKAYGDEPPVELTERKFINLRGCIIYKYTDTYTLNNAECRYLNTNVL